MTTDSNNSTPRRRWFRFSLRTLLVAMALVCIPLGRWINSVHRQQRVIADIEKNGGIVGYDVNSTHGYDVFGTKSDSQKMKWKVWFRSYASSWLRKDIYTTIGYDLFCDADFVYRHPNNAPVKADLILLHCNDLPSLQLIDLRDSNASDSGIAFLKNHPSLEELHLSGCRGITDASVPIFSEIKNLRALTLDGTKITKASIPKLAKIKNLNYLSLPDIQISEVDKKKLQETLPNTQIFLGGTNIRSPLLTDVER